MDHDNDVSNTTPEEDIGFEDEEIELEDRRAQTTEDPTKELVTCAKMQALLAKELKISTAWITASMLTELVNDQFTDALQVGYDVVQAGAKNSLLNLVGEVIADITQQGKMDL